MIFCFELMGRGTDGRTDRRGVTHTAAS